MATSITQAIKNLANVNIFEECGKTEAFVGRPFYLDFNTLRLVSNDKWKNNVRGVPAGAFLLALYNGEPDVSEAILLRVLAPTKLPTDNDVVMAMVDHYKEDSSPDSISKLDSYTRSEFQFSGLECRVIGTFYQTPFDSKTLFAGDMDNFYSPHNYRVVKPTGRLLEYIVNFRENSVPGGAGDVRIGRVRYSSSLRHVSGEEAPVYVSALDFLGKRTALFGMTRTGKSNSVKKIIQATVSLSQTNSHTDDSQLVPVGQIVFDVNGEYANANQQDDGTAIFEQYGDRVTRYSVLDKPGFKVMKVNFYSDIETGHGMLAAALSSDSSTYTKAFCNIDWTKPDNADFSAKTRYAVKVACYQACLHAAGFTHGAITVKFNVKDTIRTSGISGLDGVEPKDGLSLEQAQSWFTAAWNSYNDTSGPFQEYKKKNNRDWADDDTQNLMRFLTRQPAPKSAQSESGFRKLIEFRSMHTPSAGAPFEVEIVDLLRKGMIVIMDLSQGDPHIQRTYSDRVCRSIFADAMSRFIRNESANFVQLYFEEAHNLFPKRDDKDLSNIYNRLAKEGQKLRLGICYATQEVSSISSSILKNTQNWFVSHLNNQEEITELSRYYDFADFGDSIRRTTDKGFVRMKTDSNTFIVPVQIDQFKVENN